MDIEKEIQLLEILESVPMPPDPAPIPTAVGGFVEVPYLLNEYFRKVGVKLNLDENGKMRTEEYASLIEDHCIPTYGIKITTYKVVGVEDVLKNKGNQ